MSAGVQPAAAGGTGVGSTPQVDIVATLTFVVAVVATPRQVLWAFAVYAVVLAAWAAGARVSLLRLLGRLRWEVPFVVFAAAMPFVATGPKVAVGPLQLSDPGLWAAWNIMVKATLGVAAAALLGARVDQAQLVAGLARLRMPGMLVQIAAFMVRYSALVSAELSRMRAAQAARGFRARNVRAWPAIGAALGALFIRTYERGENVHRAMVARGYDGSAVPWATAAGPATVARWLRGVFPAMIAGVVAVISAAAAVAV